MEQVKLTDICKPKQWKTIPTNDLLKNGFPVYGANGVIGYYKEYNHKDSVVTITCRGATCGTVNITEPKSYITGNAMCLDNLRQDIMQKYLYYYLSNYDFTNVISGSAQPQITRQGLEKVVISIGTKEEQTTIVALLDKVNSIIDARQQQLAKLDELVKARFVEMFGDESNPFRWPIVDVKDIAYVQVGVVIKPAQYYTDKEHGTRTFRSLNIGPMYVKDADWVYFSEEGNRKNQKSILKENDLLVVRSGAPGTACVVTEEYAGCNAVDVIIAHPDLTKVNPFFLCAYTNLPHGKKQIDEGVGGAAQQHFNVEKYNKMRIILPPLEMQKKYKMFLEQVNKSKLSIKKSLEQVETLKKSLMQKYFG